jgi:hypothetical protein
VCFYSGPVPSDSAPLSLPSGGPRPEDGGGQRQDHSVEQRSNRPTPSTSRVTPAPGESMEGQHTTPATGGRRRTSWGGSVSMGGSPGFAQPVQSPFSMHGITPGTSRRDLQPSGQSWERRRSLSVPPPLFEVPHQHNPYPSSSCARFMDVKKPSCVPHTTQQAPF